MKFMIIGLLAMLTGPSWANDYWEYSSWRVIVQELDTWEDIRRTCSAATGGDGQPTVVVSLSNGDVGPPDFFPAVLVQEHVPRNFTTVLQNGQAAYLRFDDEDVMDGMVFGSFDEEGFAYPEVALDHPLSQWVLRAMRKN